MWHEDPAALAAALGRVRGVRRIHLFDIAPRAMRGLYSACFAAADGAVHRYLTSYYQPGALREELGPLAAMIRKRGVPSVDGRIEVGAGTGQRLHYFLPDLERERSDWDRRKRRREGYGAWRAAATREVSGALRLLRDPDGGPVACASGGVDHYLFRLAAEEDPRGVSAQLGLAGVEDLAPETALWQDIMGQWLP